MTPACVLQPRWWRHWISSGPTAIVVALVVWLANSTELQGIQAQGRPDLSGLSSDARESVESACSGTRLVDGAAAYYKCLRNQLAMLGDDTRPDLSALGPDARESVESACSGTRLVDGAAAYYKCLRNQLAMLGDDTRPDLSALGPDARESVESACSGTRLVDGAAAYYKCLRNQLSALGMPAPNSRRSSEEPVTLDSSSRPSVGTVASNVAAEVPSPSDSFIPVDDPGPRPGAVVLPRVPSPRSDWSGLWILAGIIGLLWLLGRRPTARRCPQCRQPTPTPGSLCAACTQKANQAAADRARQAAEEQAKRQAEARRQDEERAARFRTLEGLNALSGDDFEKLIASLFERDGYRARRCGGTGDDGIDIVLTVGDSTNVVQCKRWRHDVGPAVVREFYGAIMHAGARHGFIVTTAKFSSAARQFAKNKPITLVDSSVLLGWVAGSFNAQREASSPREFDPWAELGLKSSASWDEVKAAYKAEMRKYHPDYTSQLGPELQDFAKRKAQSINRAYEMLKARMAGQ